MRWRYNPCLGVTAMLTHYPVVIHKNNASDFGVTIPDLPGCFSAGSSMVEALQQAKEAIECHLEGLLLDDEALHLCRLKTILSWPKNQSARTEYGTW